MLDLAAQLLWALPQGVSTLAQATEPAGELAPLRLVTEQIVVIGTLLGAVAALPTLIEFMVERRKRREHIALSLDDERVADLKVNLAGLDGLVADLADLIDRARHPEGYPGLNLGNEILILGPILSGKKTLARKIAQLAKMDRLITVHNPRNPDALAKAKSLVGPSRREKIMLLLPSIDQVFDRVDEDVPAELDALIETASERTNILVIGTARQLEPDGPLDSAFGTKVVMPGLVRSRGTNRSLAPEVREMLAAVSKHYLGRALAGGVTLDGLTQDAVVERILESVSNPAEVEDIVVLCQTAARHGVRSGQSKTLAITPDTLERAINRVIVSVAAGAR